MFSPLITLQITGTDTYSENIKPPAIHNFQLQYEQDYAQHKNKQNDFNTYNTLLSKLS